MLTFESASVQGVESIVEKLAVSPASACLVALPIPVEYC